MPINDTTFANFYLMIVDSIKHINEEAMEKMKGNTSDIHFSVLSGLFKEQNEKFMRLISDNIPNESTYGYSVGVIDRFPLIIALLEHVQWLDKLHQGIEWRTNNTCDYSYDYSKVRQFVFDTIPILNLLNYSIKCTTQFHYNLKQDMNIKKFDDKVFGKDNINLTNDYYNLLCGMYSQVDKDPEKYIGNQIKLDMNILEHPLQCLLDPKNKLIASNDNNDNDNKNENDNQNDSTDVIKLNSIEISVHQILRIIVRYKMIFDKFRIENNLKPGIRFAPIYYLYVDNDKSKYPKIVKKNPDG